MKISCALQTQTLKDVQEKGVWKEKKNKRKRARHVLTINLIGCTKPTCPNKENDTPLDNNSLFMPWKLKNFFTNELGLNLIFNIKY